MNKNIKKNSFVWAEHWADGMKKVTLWNEIQSTGIITSCTVLVFNRTSRSGCVCARVCVGGGIPSVRNGTHTYKGQFFILIFAMVRRIVEIPKHNYCIVWQEGQSIWANGIKKLTPRNDL